MARVYSPLFPDDYRYDVGVYQYIYQYTHICSVIGRHIKANKMIMIIADQLIGLLDILFHPWLSDRVFLYKGHNPFKHRSMCPLGKD